MRTISALGIVASWFLMGFLPIVATDSTRIGYAALTGVACVILMTVGIILFKPDRQLLWMIPVAIGLILLVVVGLVSLLSFNAYDLLF